MNYFHLNVFFAFYFLGCVDENQTLCVLAHTLNFTHVQYCIIVVKTMTRYLSCIKCQRMEIC